MPAQTNRDSDKFMLRFPEGMREAIKEAARKSGRSMNAEIIHRLESSLVTDKMTAETFLGIMEVQHDNAQRLAAALRNIADGVETLGTGAVEVSG